MDTIKQAYQGEMFEYKVISGNGYEIYRFGRIFIRQTLLPNGGTPFPSDRVAEDMARLIIAKLKVYLPPYILIAEEEYILENPLTDGKIQEIVYDLKN